MMAFLVPNVHQVNNAAQAVHEVFRKLGFKQTSTTKDGEYLTGEEERLRVLILFGDRESGSNLPAELHLHSPP
jgi:hypothetical protein